MALNLSSWNQGTSINIELEFPNIPEHHSSSQASNSKMEVVYGQVGQLVFSNGNENMQAGALPSEGDILCGQSKTCMMHKGSCYFRSVVAKYLKRYLEAETKGDKTALTTRIMELLLMEGRRFLKLNEDTKQWEPLTPKTIKEKIGHALRHARKIYLKKQERKATKSKEASCQPSQSHVVSVWVMDPDGKQNSVQAGDDPRETMSAPPVSVSGVAIATRTTTTNPLLRATDQPQEQGKWTDTEDSSSLMSLLQLPILEERNGDQLCS